MDRFPGVGDAVAVITDIHANLPALPAAPARRSGLPAQFADKLLLAA